jgi:hypothetical protein
LNENYYKNYFKGQLEKANKGDIITKFYDPDSFYVDTKDAEGKSVGKVRISVTVYPG